MLATRSGLNRVKAGFIYNSDIPQLNAIILESTAIKLILMYRMVVSMKIWDGSLKEDWRIKKK